MAREQHARLEDSLGGDGHILVAAQYDGRSNTELHAPVSLLQGDRVKSLLSEKRLMGLGREPHIAVIPDVLECQPRAEKLGRKLPGHASGREHVIECLLSDAGFLVAGQERRDHRLQLLVVLVQLVVPERSRIWTRQHLVHQLCTAVNDSLALVGFASCITIS